MKLMKNFAVKLGVSALGLLLAACTPQTKPSLLTSTSSVADVNKKILDQIPFAYDLVVDTISYNSCVGRGLNNGGRLHGLKIGASEGYSDSTGSGNVRSGLKLRSEFLQYVAQNVEPVYPNTTVVSSQLKYLLESSDKNKDLMIQYAVRDRTNLSVMADVVDLNKFTGQYLLGRDGIYDGTNVLSMDPVLTNLTKDIQFGAGKTVLVEGQRIGNLGMAAAPDAIEGSFAFSAIDDQTFQVDPAVEDATGAGEQYSDIVRSRFNSGSQVLAITFGNQSFVASGDTSGSFGLNSPKRPDGAPLSRAYGRSFELNFASKNPSVPSQRRNILSRVVEKNLENGSTPTGGASWSCENYVIMRSSELNNKRADKPACSEINASDLAAAGTGPVLRDKLSRIRRHYSETDWAVGFLVRENTVYNPAPAARAALPICLVNKAVDCYLNTVGIIPTEPATDIGVNYSAAVAGNLSECYLSRYANMGVSYSGNKSIDQLRRLGRCPQYASICVRTSF